MSPQRDRGITLIPACSSRLPFVCDQSRPYREPDESGQITNAEALHDRATMRLDGLDAEAKHSCDLLRGVSLGDEAEDLSLTRGESLQGRIGIGLRRFSRESCDQRLRDGGRQIHLALTDGADCGLQLLLVRVFQ